ncbi:unnamed protein product [Tilletia controversa]|nr:unnamed protein product [Tilletia controversa]
MSQSFSPSWKDLGKLSERLVQRLAEQGSRTTRSTASSRSGHVLPKTSPAASCASVTPRQSQGTLESKFEDKKNGIAICGPRPSRRGSDRATWNRALEAIVPLPETVRTQPSHDYTYGSQVMALNPDTTCLYRATIVSGGRVLQCLVIVETPASLAAHLLVTNPDAKAQGAVIAYDGRHGSKNLVDGLLLVPRGARLVFDWIVLEDSYLGKQDEATGSANMLCRLLALASPALNNASSPVLLSSPTLLFLRTTYSIQHSSCRHSAAKSARTDDGQTSTVLSIVQRWSRASSFSLERSAALTSHFRFFVHTVQDLLTRWSPRQNSICLAIPSRTSDSQPPADDDMPAGRVTRVSSDRKALTQAVSVLVPDVPGTSVPNGALVSYDVDGALVETHLSAPTSFALSRST